MKPAPSHAPFEADAGAPIHVLMTLDAVGGVWRYAMELARPLRRLGVRVLFAGLGPEPTAAQMAEAGSLGEVEWLPLPLDWMADGPGELAGVSPALERLALERGCDLMHLNAPSQASGLKGRLPVVAVSHSCVASWWATMRGGPMPEELRWHHGDEAEGLARSGAIVAPSFAHADAIERCYGRLARLEVVHNGISAFLGNVQREAFVFSAGRWWDEGKDGGAIDRAATRIAWPVRLAGPLAAPGGGAVSFRNAEALGSLPHAAVLDHVRRAGIVVSASRYEPFGLLALEGARARAPMVLSDNPTYRELWKGAALFFEPGDSASLAARVGELIADAALREEMAALALARSRRFTPDRQARAMREIYDGVSDAAPALAGSAA